MINPRLVWAGVAAFAGGLLLMQRRASAAVLDLPTLGTLPAPGHHYTVASGDTLGHIASRFGTSLGQWSQANPDKAKRQGWPDLIYAAEALSIPQAGIDHGPSSGASGRVGV